jgi:hypothetical protein
MKGVNTNPPAFLQQVSFYYLMAAFALTVVSVSID